MENILPSQKKAIICTDSTLKGADEERQQVEVDKIVSDLDGHGYEITYLDRTDIDGVFEVLGRDSGGRKAVQFLCGHSDQIPGIYHEDIIATAEKAAAAGFNILTPGSNNGLMLSVAKAALDAGHEVTGISSLPIAFEEPPYPEITNIIFAAREQDRNEWYKRLADVYIAGAGSLGTIGEIFNSVVEEYVECFWRKPSRDVIEGDGMAFTPHMVLNTPTELYPDGYFAPLQDMIDRTITVNAGPLYAKHMIAFESSPDELVAEMVRRANPETNRQMFADMNTHVAWKDGKIVEVEGKEVAYAPPPPESANRRPSVDITNAESSEKTTEVKRARGNRHFSR